MNILFYAIKKYFFKSFKFEKLLNFIVISFFSDGNLSR